jgi:hypothetical protein
MASKGNRKKYTNCDGNKIVGGSGCGLYRPTVPEFAWGRDYEKPTRSLNSYSGFLADV